MAQTGAVTSCALAAVLPWFVHPCGVREGLFLSQGDGLPDNASWIPAVSSCIFGACPG